MMQKKLLNPATPLFQNRVKVNIATPAYGGNYCSEYVQTLYRLLTKKTAVSFSFSDVDYCDIETSRNYLISNFYYNKTDCSHILFMDSDMGFPEELIFQMIDLDEDVVGAVCPKRNLDLEGLHANGSLPYNEAYYKALEFIGTPTDQHPKNSSFKKVSSIGTGLLLVSRECLDKMISSCPEIVDEIRYKKTFYAAKFDRVITPFKKIELLDRDLAEDFSFCYRWTQRCQGEIYAGVDFEIQHVAKICVKGKFSQ